MLAEITNFTLDNVSDYISALPIGYYSGFLYFALISDYNLSVFYWKCLFGLLFTTLTTDLLKRLPYSKNVWKYTRRPEGANNTDFLSKKGLCKKDSPGFPSGHMSITSYFITISNTYLVQSSKQGHFVNALLLLSMGWSRYYKCVHTLPQIVGGTLYGIICGLITLNFL